MDASNISDTRNLYSEPTARKRWHWGTDTKHGGWPSTAGTSVIQVLSNSRETSAGEMPETVGNSSTVGKPARAWMPAKAGMPATSATQRTLYSEPTARKRWQ